MSPKANFSVARGPGWRRRKPVLLVLTVAAAVTGAGLWFSLQGGGSSVDLAGDGRGRGADSEALEEYGGPIIPTRQGLPGGGGAAGQTVTAEKRAEVEAGCLHAMALTGRLPRLGAEPLAEQLQEMRAKAGQWLSETGEGGRERRKLEDWVEKDAKNREPEIAALEAHLWGTEVAEMLENAYTQPLMGDFLMRLFSSPEHFLAAAPGPGGSLDSLNENRFGKVRRAKPPLKEWVRILDAVVSDRLTSYTAPGTNIDEPAAGRETTGETGIQETASGAGKISEKAETPEKNGDEPPEEIVDYLRDEVRATIMLNLGAE